MLFDQSRIIEQANLTYFSHRKACEKQIETIQYQRIKQVKAFKSLKPEKNKEGIK